MTLGSMLILRAVCWQKATAKVRSSWHKPLGCRWVSFTMDWDYKNALLASLRLSKNDRATRILYRISYHSFVCKVMTATIWRILECFTCVGSQLIRPFCNRSCQQTKEFIGLVAQLQVQEQTWWLVVVWALAANFGHMHLHFFPTCFPEVLFLGLGGLLKSWIFTWQVGRC